MPYTPTTWTDNTTPLSAANLNHLETQYKSAMTDGGIPYAVDTGAVNALAATVSPAPTAYSDGLSVKVKVANTTTGATTLNVNGLGAVAVKNADGSAVGSGDLVTGVPRIFTYVAGTPAAFIAAGSGGLSASGNATPADVRVNKTFTSQGGRAQTGTLADNGNGPTVTPGTSNQTLAAGIWDSPITVQGDPNLVATNILKGVSVFGVAGSVGRTANGLATAGTSTSGVPGRMAGTTTSTGLYTLTVSGLSFTPSLVLVKIHGTWSDDEWVSITTRAVNSGDGSYNSALSHDINGNTQYLFNSSLVAGGFTTYVAHNGGQYDWWAFE